MKLILLTSLAAFTAGQYTSSIKPVEYSKEQIVPLYFNTLTSENSALSFDIYKDFKFCPPAGGIVEQPLSLGSILFGDHIKSSPFELKMGVNETCKLACQGKLDLKDVANYLKALKHQFRFNWLVDYLPVASVESFEKLDEFQSGIPIGSPEKFIYNHFDFLILYNEEIPEHHRIVGVYVQASSKNTVVDETSKTIKCDVPEPFKFKTDITKESYLIYYTYSVNWKKSELNWDSRLDRFMQKNETKIRWFGIINATVVVLFLSAMVGLILLRALKKDISRYNQITDFDEIQDDFGWKLVHGDVFRPPSKGMYLGVLLGSGIQLIATSLISLILATLGILSSSNRGSLLTTTLAFYILFSFFSGYISAAFFKSVGGENWKRNVFANCFLVPGLFFAMFLIINLIQVTGNSSASIPFSTILNLIFLWLLVSVPLCFFGSYKGFKAQKISFPANTNQIPRQIPLQPSYLKPTAGILIGGLLPFAAIFVELYYIMGSIWRHTLYHLFGFMLLVFIILAITCSEVAILFCYFHLCAEDYRWWWRSFFTAGSTGLYVFLYGIYFYTKLNVSDTASTFFYFGYTILVSLVVFIITGTIGFLSCFVFVRKIYGSIKID